MEPRADDSRSRSGQQYFCTGGDIGKISRGGYRIIRFGERPVIALPAEPTRLKLAGLAQYHPFTPKRRLFSIIIHLFILANLDGLISTVQGSPLPAMEDFGFGEWLELICAWLGERDLTAAVVWPRQRHRRRTYVHLLRPSGQLVGFCKLASVPQASGLEREVAALTALGKQREQLSARVPQILCHGVFRDHRYVLYEPLPVSAVPFTGSW